MKTVSLILALALGMAGPPWLNAQEKAEEGYQRFDMVRKPSEFTAEGTLRFRTETVGTDQLYTFSPGLRLEYSLATNHTFEASLPYTLSIYESLEARQRLYYALGDLQLSYEYLHQSGHVNWFLGPLASIPLTPNTEYAAREGVLSAGSGRYTAGAKVSVTGIRDPVVWNGGLQYTVGLPKKERFLTAWQPGNMQISAGITDLLNEQFGFSLSLHQGANLPAVTDGIWDKAGSGLTVSTMFQLEAFSLFEHGYLRIVLEAYVYPPQQPITTKFVYGRQFTIRDARK
ncbi:MAG: hypothetical protein LBT16_01120 [Treponema sp.]|jgi:hypothetical protein|nr:hypothetical protein [Treponema sp.]